MNIWRSGGTAPPFFTSAPDGGKWPSFMPQGKSLVALGAVLEALE
jgi:hypothetical protein